MVLFKKCFFQKQFVKLSSRFRWTKIKLNLLNKQICLFSFGLLLIKGMLFDYICNISGSTQVLVETRLPPQCKARGAARVSKTYTHGDCLSKRTSEHLWIRSIVVIFVWEFAENSAFEVSPKPNCYALNIKNVLLRDMLSYVDTIL